MTINLKDQIIALPQAVSASPRNSGTRFQETIEAVASPMIKLIAGNSADFLEPSEHLSLPIKTLELLLICHPYETRQETAAVSLNALPFSVAQTVIEAAIPCGMKSGALRESSHLLVRNLGREKSAEILRGLKSTNEHITDLLIETVQGGPGRRVVSSDSSTARHSHQGVEQTEPSPLDRFALEAFKQLVPFASQKLTPERFDARYLNTVWENFEDDLTMKVFAAAFAAFQTDQLTRALVLEQVTILDSALAACISDLVNKHLAESLVHLSDSEYYTRYQKAQ